MDNIKYICSSSDGEDGRDFVTSKDKSNLQV